MFLKRIRIPLWLLLLSLLACTQTYGRTVSLAEDSGVVDLKVQIEKACFSHDMEWVRVLYAQALDQVAKYPAAMYPHYYAGLISIQLGNIARAFDRGAAFSYYQEALKHLRVAHEREPNAETAVVLADAYGKLASLKTLKMLYYGSRSKTYLQAAFKFNPHNPKCHLIAGIEIMWTPAIFGGSKDRARKFLNKALALTREWQESDPLIVQWAAVPEILAHLAQLEILCGAPDRARQYAKQALRHVPDYAFVRRDILPQLAAGGCQERPKGHT